jgi:hypothetical protein
MKTMLDIFEKIGNYGHPFYGNRNVLHFLTLGMLDEWIFIFLDKEI